MLEYAALGRDHPSRLCFVEATMYEDFFRRRGRDVLFFRYAPPKRERELSDDVSSAKQPNPPYPDAPGWHCSVYYYWWRFIRLNEDFRRAVRSGAAQEGTVVHDFRRALDYKFRDWWPRYGRHLFCEPPELGLRLEEPPVPAARVDDRIVVSVPPHANLERVLADMRSLLQPVMASKKAETGGSRARYPVWTKPVLTSLEQHYQIWRVHDAQPDLNYIQLADAVGIMKAYEDSLETRNKKSAVASRMIKQAKFMIEQTAHGRFPVMNQKQLDAGMGKFPQIPPSGLPDEEAGRNAILATIDDMFEDDPAKAAEMKVALFPDLFGDK